MYSTLYNSAGSQEEMATLQQNIILLTPVNSIHEVNRVSGYIVKTVAGSMKPRESDVTNWYTSDVLLNAPDELLAGSRQAPNLL